ncbi:MAG: hypothetical protein KF896_10675 [Ignavibacteriae bacterium]|nr:hypothetical protein [Ignavibacteriota bacterium]
MISDISGLYIYPLDDTYIHLAIAENLSEHSVWGVTSHEFSSSSSSILYTLILAFLIKIFGSNGLLPLIVNIVITYIITIYLFHLFTKFYYDITSREKSDILSHKENLQIFLVTLITSIFAPVIILTLSGMEHNLQILLTIAFVDYLVRSVNNYSKSDFIKLLLLSVAVTSVRFEGIFLIFLAIILLIIKKRYQDSFFVLISGLLPIIIYGLVSTGNGWMLLPNSILLKSTKPDAYTTLGILTYPLKWVFVLFKEHHLLTLFVAASGLLYVNFKRTKKLFDEYSLWLLLTVSLIIIHLTFARTGWVYRYEAYIIVIGYIAVFVNALNLLKNGERYNRNAIIALVAVMIFAGSLRAYKSIVEAQTMSVNIYEQQFQMSQYLKEYYNESTVVLGDIGACTYFTDIKLIDLVGLGSLEPLKMRIDKKFNRESIQMLTEKKNADIAIIYKEAWEGYIPENWLEAGSWKISNNIGCFKDEVTFYAVKAENFLSLSENLIQFRKKLPHTVEVNINIEQFLQESIPDSP